MCMVHGSHTPGSRNVHGTRLPYARRRLARVLRTILCSTDVHLKSQIRDNYKGWTVDIWPANVVQLRQNGQTKAFIAAVPNPENIHPRQKAVCTHSQMTSYSNLNHSDLMI